jgi:hypothetical protein
MRYEVDKLLNVFDAHGSIIVGLDFDDTVFPLTNSEYVVKRCEKVRDLINSFQPSHLVVCLYTVSDFSALEYKKSILNFYHINYSYVNKSPIKMGDGSKPFFNILLDDKAGLNESIEILTDFHKNIYQ